LDEAFILFRQVHFSLFLPPLPLLLFSFLFLLLLLLILLHSFLIVLLLLLLFLLPNFPYTLLKYIIRFFI